MTNVDTLNYRKRIELRCTAAFQRKLLADWSQLIKAVQECRLIYCETLCCRYVLHCKYVVTNNTIQRGQYSGLRWVGLVVALRQQILSLLRLMGMWCGEYILWCLCANVGDPPTLGAIFHISSFFRVENTESVLQIRHLYLARRSIWIEFRKCTSEKYDLNLIYN